MTHFRSYSHFSVRAGAKTNIGKHGGYKFSLAVEEGKVGKGDAKTVHHRSGVYCDIPPHVRITPGFKVQHNELDARCTVHLPPVAPMLVKNMLVQAYQNRELKPEGSTLRNVCVNLVTGKSKWFRDVCEMKDMEIKAEKEGSGTAHTSKVKSSMAEAKQERTKKRMSDARSRAQAALRAKRQRKECTAATAAFTPSPKAKVAGTVASALTGALAEGNPPEGNGPADEGDASPPGKKDVEQTA